MDLHAAGAVKASPTLAYGNLYFGDYSGHVQAVSEGTGARLWLAKSRTASCSAAASSTPRRP